MRSREASTPRRSRSSNAPFTDLVAIHTKQAPYHTYAIGARVAPDTITHALYWDTEDPFHYVRLEHNTEDRDVLIVGGEDHRTGQGGGRPGPVTLTVPCRTDGQGRWGFGC